MANQGNARGGSSDQHSKAGSQSHKNDDTKSSSGSESSTRGGTPEQHAEAGRQSHKNDDKSDSSNNKR